MHTRDLTYEEKEILIDVFSHIAKQCNITVTFRSKGSENYRSIGFSDERSRYAVHNKYQINTEAIYLITEKEFHEVSFRINFIREKKMHKKDKKNIKSLLQLIRNNTLVQSIKDRSVFLFLKPISNEPMN